MYEFTQDCLIGVPEIDEEHRQLFQMLNEAFSLLGDPSNTTIIIKNLIPALKNYAATHFAHEEAYMEQIKDPELSLQKKEHAAFVAKINNIELSSDASEQTLRDLLEFLTRWLYHHILGSDMMIGQIAPDSDAETASDPFAFTDKYLTGITFIDTEHAKLFELIRDVNDVIHNDTLHDKYDEIMRLLAGLRNYTEEHFHDEEEYMESIGYPGLDAQRRAHSAFVEKLVGINLSELDFIDDNQDAYLSELINYLLDWLSNHILKSDLQIAAFKQQ